MKEDAFRILHGCRGSVGNVVREVDQELGQAALGGSVVAEDGGEGSVSKGLRQALPECLPSSTVIAQALNSVSDA